MRFFTILSSLLAGSAVAIAAPAPVQHVARDTDVNTGLLNIISGLKTFNDTLNHFSPLSLGTVGGLFDVLKASNKLGDDIIAATNAASSSQQLSFDDSTTVAQTIFKLYPDIQSVLANLVAHRKQFDSVALLLSVRNTVLSAVQNDNKLQKDLGAALVPKLAKGFQSAGPYVLKQIQDAFDSALANYSKHMSGLDLPAIPSKVKNGKVVNA